jgi:hypothetical protein
MIRKSGWYNDSYRHYLAAKGISTARKKYFSVFGNWIRDTGDELIQEKEKYYKQLPGRDAAILRAQQTVIAAERATPLTDAETRAASLMIGRAGRGPNLQQRREILDKEKKRWFGDASHPGEKQKQEAELAAIVNKLKKEVDAAKKDLQNQQQKPDMTFKNKRGDVQNIYIKSLYDVHANLSNEYNVQKQKYEELHNGEDSESMRIKKYEANLLDQLMRVRRPSPLSSYRQGLKDAGKNNEDSTV